MNRAPALEIARREFVDNLATWKTPLAFALTTLLLVTGVLSVADGYDSSRATYQLVQDEYLAQGEQSGAAALSHRFLAAPNPLALLVGGPAEAARSALAAPPSISNESLSVREPPVTLRFAAMDLGSVGVGVLTLLAILFSYDAVAGEKERGTLKLLLVNPLARRDVLLGKYLGAMASLLLPLGGAFVLALLGLRAAGIRLAPGDHARLLLILLVLVALLSAFVLLGLAISSLTHRTAVAVLALSLVWVVLVAGAGSLAAFASGVGSDARGIDAVMSEMQVLHEHYDEQQRLMMEVIASLEAKNETQGGALSTDDRARLDGLRAELRELPARRAQDQKALLDGYYEGLDADFRRALGYASLSPAEAFRSVSQGLARTDHDALRERLDEFSAYLREVETLRAERGGEAQDFVPPPFRSSPVSVTGDVARVQPFLAMLLVENAVAFLVALGAFGRYDVR